MGTCQLPVAGVSTSAAHVGEGEVSLADWEATQGEKQVVLANTSPSRCQRRLASQGSEQERIWGGKRGRKKGGCGLPPLWVLAQATLILRTRWGRKWQEELSSLGFVPPFPINQATS